ncbi:hypothetical protein DVH24_021325 [Malus domestica]|uniref:Uncharacterized protein n=2 Tax=Malus domestica TaxID=3750 RepID=A0A498KR77_MALDO|nr:hypothetical protein DVH24_021325 [Malus domestica]
MMILSRVGNSSVAIRPQLTHLVPSNFHKLCDFKGQSAIIGYTNKPFKFGAFNPEGLQKHKQQLPLLLNRQCHN